MKTIDADLYGSKESRPCSVGSIDFITIRREDFFEWLEESNRRAGKNEFWKSIRI